jgi:iron complex outermembrane recepter protein
MSIKKLNALPVTTMLTFGLLATGAQAQTTGTQTQSPAAVSEEKAADSKAAADVIIVTARRREERLQDVAATIDVLGGDQLARTGITDASQIEYSIPGLQFGNNGFDGSLIGLRGVSSQRGFTGDEAAVAVHVDGVFLPQSGQALARLFDVERIEVLKGPQGTLYGRNANAGVINIISRAPTEEPGGYSQISYGSFNTVRGEGAINLRLADNQVLRLSAAGASGDGYIRNVLDNRTLADNDFYAGRLRYRGTFDAATVDLTVQYVHDSSQNDAAVTPARRAAIIRTDRAVGFFDTLINVPTSQSRDDLVGALQIDFDLGPVGIKSITGATYFKNKLRADSSLADEIVPTGFGAGRQSGNSFSQELTLYGQDTSVFDWRAGLYYTYSKVEEFRSNVTAGAPNPNNDFYDDFLLNQSGNAYAVFADIGWQVTDTLKLSVGGRYNREEKRQDQAETFGIFEPVGPVRNCTAVTPGTFETCFSSDEQRKAWDGVTARAGVDWKVSSDNLLYASYGRGFRSGAIGGIIGVDNFLDRAFGGAGRLPLTPLNPEKVDAFEIGSKNSFADGRFFLNVAGFYTEFKDQLFTATDPAQNFRVIEGNLGLSRIKGVDILASAQLFTGFRLSANAEFLEAKVRELSTLVSPDIAVGNTLPRAPKFSSAISADWRIDLGAGALDLRAEYNHKSFHFLNLQNTLSQPSVNLVNLSVRYETSADRGFYVFGNLRNLTGEKYLVAGGIPTTAGPRFAGQARPGEPLTFEIGGGFKF